MPSELSTLLAAALGGYLLGSVPFGVLVMRAAGAGDPRGIGSGNIGATNVLRSGRKDLAALTLLGDVGKGVLAVLAARALTGDDPAAVALAAGGAFVGHLFPIWLRLRGGKGVATFFGVLLAAAWPAGVLAALTWICMAVLFRISSLSALVASLLAPFFMLATDQPDVMPWLAGFMTALIWFKHADNIGRLLKGQEPKIGRKKPA